MATVALLALPTRLENASFTVIRDPTLSRNLAPPTSSARFMATGVDHAGRYWRKTR